MCGQNDRVIEIPRVGIARPNRRVFLCPSHHLSWDQSRIPTSRLISYAEGITPKLFV